jgi:hypothetical protein
MTPVAAPVLPADALARSLSRSLKCCGRPAMAMDEAELAAELLRSLWERVKRLVG